MKLQWRPGWIGHAIRSEMGRKRITLASALLAALCSLLLLPDTSSANAGNLAFNDLRLFGTGMDTTHGLALGDMDGDGDLDIVVGNGGWTSGSQNVVYLNDGFGDFDWSGAAHNFGTGSDKTESVAVGDVDDDGDLDIVVGNEGQQNAVYLNGGGGDFTTSHSFGTGSDSTTSVAVGDVNGDGTLDIVVGNDEQANVVHLNDGTGSFDWPGAADNFGTGSDRTESVALGDVNDDGHLDIVAGNGMDSAVYLNDGGGHFHAGPLDCSSPPAGVQCFGTGADVATSVALGDADGDGDLDIALGGSYTQNVVYLNDGAGHFDYGPLDCNGTNVRCLEGFATESVVMADVDGDGDLDLIVGNAFAVWAAEQNSVYLNDGSGDFSTQLDLGTGTDITYGVVAGDVDNDGDLDVAVGNSDQQNVVYLNNGVGRLPTGRYYGNWGTAYSVVMGDVDHDGDLDLFTGRTSGQNTISLNDGSGQFYTGEVDCSNPPTGIRCFGTGSAGARSLALGDLDSDGDLDIVAGSDGSQNAVYLNDGIGGYYTGTVNCSAPPANVRCFGTGSDSTKSVALGDLDNDGDLDIVSGNADTSLLPYTGKQNAVYLNDGDNDEDGSWDGTFTTRHFGTGSDMTFALALGDLEHDGDLDIIIGNYTEPNQIYLNDGAGHFYAGPNNCSDPPANVRCFGTGSDTTASVALGDLDGDGDLDIAVGNVGPNVVYLNDGAGGFYNCSLNCSVSNVRCFGTGSDTTRSIMAADMDGDGDLDLVVGNCGQVDRGEPSWIYLNDGAAGFKWSSPARGFFTDYGYTRSVAAGDLDGDGTPDVAAAQGSEWMMDLSVVNMNPVRFPKRLANNPPAVVVNRPGTSANADLYSSAEILESVTIPVTYTLFDRESNPVRFIRTFYSPDGGGRWLPAMAAGSTVTTSLSASPWPTGTNYTFAWDTFKSGFFGQSDNVVFRIEAYPSLRPMSNTVSGPYQWPYAATTTFPFRVRGTQVRVLSSTVPAEGAIVYRIPVGQSRGQPFADGSGIPYRTDVQGYLQGRGQLQVDDRLVALLPISATESYTLYCTSAAPTPTGLAAHTVVSPGVQTLVVSATHSLLLFNLDVSLQWDARNDAFFMSQLEYNLQRTSELLFDWTDGQVALGNVTVYHDRDHWNDAHVRVYATNRLRPNAAQGGISPHPISDTHLLTITYAPGQVHMPALWNRYGESGSSIADDWPRTLAHELGHFALFLDDNYIGLDPNGLVIPVTGCTGAMGDPYRTDFPYDEFHADDLAWQQTCTQTLSHRITGRADWATIQSFYHALSGPAPTNNPGPTALPLAVTQIHLIEPITPSITLDDPTFYLVDQVGGPVQPGPSARAFLFQDDWLTDLGRPTLDRVLARGARVGDRVCLYQLDAARLGCETVKPDDDQLQLADAPDWQPDLLVSPVSSRTVTIHVSNIPTTGWSLEARLFPLTDPAPDAISLTQTADGFSATLTLDQPTFEGFVQLTVLSPTHPLRQIVTDYSLGGSPVHVRQPHTTVRGRLVHVRQPHAPGISADGQVILFGESLEHLEENDFFTLQAATLLPSLPPWTTLVGQGYRLLASSPTLDFGDASITFQYMGDEVPPGEETWLRLYYLAPLSTTWHLLPTTLDTYHNLASAPVQGQGLYALMSSLEIPLYGPGWNNFAYPVQGTRPVSQALLSISGYYTTVYGYEPSDAADPWKLYDVTVPGWVNDLHTLEFGHGYWINLSTAITLYLKGGSGELMATGTGFPLPPATFYGPVLPGSTFVPTAGMTVTAWVDGHLCGQGILTDVAGYGVAYVVDVPADAEVAGCGAPGREVSFQVGAEAMIPTAAWDNNQVRELTLRPLWRAYLPLVERVPPPPPPAPPWW